MEAVSLLIAFAALGIDVGWKNGPDGQPAYTFEIETQLISELRNGQAIVSAVDAKDRVNLRRFQIFVGKATPSTASGSFTPRGVSGFVERNDKVQYGWKPSQDGTGVDYFIQISPERMETLASGTPILDVIDPSVTNIQRFYIFIGVENLPRELPAGTTRTGREPSEFVQADSSFGAGTSPANASLRGASLGSTASGLNAPGTVGLAGAATGGSTSQFNSASGSATVNPNGQFNTATAQPGSNLTGRTNSATQYGSQSAADQWQHVPPAPGTVRGGSFGDPNSGANTMVAANGGAGGTLPVPQIPNPSTNYGYGANASNVYRPADNTYPAQGAASNGSQANPSGQPPYQQPPYQQQPYASYPQQQPAYPPPNWQQSYPGAPPWNQLAMAQPPGYGAATAPSTSASAPSQPAAAAPAATSPATASEAAAPKETRSSLPLILTTLMLFAALGANAYLGWLAWSFFWRFREAASELSRARSEAFASRHAA